MSATGTPPARREPPTATGDGAIVEGWVVRTQSGFYAVETAAGPVTATLRGRLKRDRDANDLVALGDRVRLQATASSSGGDEGARAVIVERLERTTSLTRRAPGPKGVWSKDVVVANIDQLLVTFSCHRPEPNLRLIDRFLALAEIDELDSAIVITKIDLGLSPELAAALDDYRRIGYSILPVSARSGEGLDAVRRALAGRVSAVVGPSGVGKSSLLNAIEPGLALQVGAVSEAHYKGRHTTRVGELHPLTGGGRVADTPGLRELALWEVDGAELQWGFVEFRPHLNRCRFDDCTHVHEPGCAVQAAVTAGDVSPRRYDSYVRLLAGDVERA